MQIVDYFHVIQLANRALDRVRRRVQVETQGHRGRGTDPLYRIRRTLITAQEHVSHDTSQRLASMLKLGDPHAEVAFTYRIKERLWETYQQHHYTQAEPMLDHLITTAKRASSPPEVQQLARTLNRWKPQILAWHHTKLSNGPTESINNLIKHIKHTGYGFTNFTNYRTRILLYAGNPNWRLLNTIFP